MATRFEWVTVDGGRKAEIWTDIELSEIDGDTGDRLIGLAGVGMASASDAIMLYGTPEDLAAWAEDLAARLRAGEGASGWGEARELVFTGPKHLVRDAEGEVYEAEQLDERWRLRDNSGEVGEDDDAVLTGDTWRVLGRGEMRRAENGEFGFVVRTRKVLD